MAKDRDKKDDEEIITEALERYDEACSAWSEVDNDGLVDIKFARNSEQWPDDIKNQRSKDGRPCLTINHMPKFIRQVVNDARQNKPSIKVRPANKGASPGTAEVFAGIIRNIESTSDADVAYDTAGESAVGSAVGFFRIDVDYTSDDSFEKDIKFSRILNRFSVKWDPLTQACDSSDWRFCFITDEIPKKEFERRYPGCDTTPFTGESSTEQNWFTEDMVRVAEYWTRDEVEREIVLFTDGVEEQVIDAEELEENPDVAETLLAANMEEKSRRTVKSYKVTHRLITGREVISETAWAGSIIPVIPVYGDEFNLEGKRVFRSLIYDAKDSQRMFNYWRTTSTELLALAPKAPWIGRKGAFETDAEKWATANTESHAFIEYDGAEAPKREMFDGVPTGVLQEANLAAEDMRQIIGISNPALGVDDMREQSGRALRMRRSESDTSTYHFHDNMNRAVRCAGRVLIELIPKVYNSARVVRVLGMDGKEKLIPVNQEFQGPNGEMMNYDLTAGKYDVVVEAGPSYSTRREEAAETMTAFIQAYPPAAPLLGDMIARNSDWPDADKVADRLESQLPPNIRAKEAGQPEPAPQPPPEVQAAQAKAQADMAIAQQKAQVDAQLEQQRAQNQQEIEKIQAMADIEVMRQKAQAEMALARERAALEMDLKRREAELSAQLKMMTATQPQPEVRA